MKLLAKNVIRLAAASLVIFGLIISLQAMAEEPECDQCVVTNKKGKILFHCKTADEDLCSTTAAGKTLSCSDAEGCDIEPPV